MKRALITWSDAGTVGPRPAHHAPRPATDRGPVRRLLAGKGHIEEAVRSRAQQAFMEQGLTRTERGTGVLVFASLLEHRAVVLGDHGIHEKMGDEGWQKGVEALVAGIRRAVLDSRVRVETRGGWLTISWPGPGAPVAMTGPAATVFEGEWEIPAP